MGDSVIWLAIEVPTDQVAEISRALTATLETFGIDFQKCVAGSEAFEKQLDDLRKLDWLEYQALCKQEMQENPDPDDKPF